MNINNTHWVSIWGNADSIRLTFDNYCGTVCYGVTYESYGLKGTKRFDHEVPTDGADTVIIQQGINDWMRTTDLVDGCIDFDKALCDPDNPSIFLPIYDSGDHLHPSKEGYKKMAETVLTEILK